MVHKVQASARFFLCCILIPFSFFHFEYCHAIIEGKKSEEKLSMVDIGVIQDLNSPFGTMINLCVEMAIADFYSAHRNYNTRLRLQTKDARSTIDVGLAVLELLEQEQVHGVLGPQGSTEETFITQLAAKAHVPIISYTARTSSPTTNHYFVRTAPDDVVQARALAAIFQAFKWSQVVILYEDTEYGHQFLSHLNKAFKDVGIQLAHLTVIPSTAENDDLDKELNVLNEKQINEKQIRTFLVHMNASLGFRLFSVASDLGMLSEGNAWIITDSLSNFLINSMDPAARDSMEGVVGIRPYVPFSKELQDFQERWKRESINLKKNSGQIMDLNVYGYWAYDTVTALAIAVEKIGPVDPDSLYLETPINVTKRIRISSFGPRLLRELSNTRLRGLSGDFQLVDGKLKPSEFEIFNVFGNGERRVGFWTPNRGITRELIISSPGDAKYSTSRKELKNIVWPGDSIAQPKGWSISKTGVLRVGVPMKTGYAEFVNAVIDTASNSVHATGFAVDIFKAAIEHMPFHVNYEFHCYNETYVDGKGYDDMLLWIPHQKVDMLVADLTIWSPRAKYADFSLPYSESGVVLVVKNKKPMDMWIFTKPLRWDLWLAIAVSCIVMGIVIRILERREAVRQRHAMIYLAPIAVLAFQERNMVKNNWSSLVLVSWLFMAFILMQSFTANLSAILTVDQLKFAFSKDYYLGYQSGSFLKQFLTQNLNINESRLRDYTSPEDFHNAMSRGSKNEGIDAIFDEIPYIKLFMNQYESQYKIVGPTYKTNGLGFAFPVGSALATYFSRAILNVTQGSGMISIEQGNFGPGYSSQDPLSSTMSQGTSSLTSYDFAGLFIIVASVTVFALACSETAILSKLRIITRNFVNSLRTEKGSDINDDGVTTNPHDDDEDANIAASAGVDRNEQQNEEQEDPQHGDGEIAEVNNGARDDGDDPVRMTRN